MHDNNDQLYKVIEAQIQSALWECCHPIFADKISKNKYIYEKIVGDILKDLDYYFLKDPASRNSIISIAQSYTSFKAVLHYRIANNIYYHTCYEDREIYSISISNRGKILSGAEIHYKSIIGNNFILDHGYGTVIGETTIIGNNCYLLGGVVLGACGISNNPTCQRHPRIGNNVEIGAFTRIFGTVNIGDNVFIGPNCLIIEDIPNDSRVVTKTSNQIIKRAS